MNANFSLKTEFLIIFFFCFIVILSCNEKQEENLPVFHKGGIIPDKIDLSPSLVGHWPGSCYSLLYQRLFVLRV